MNFDLVPGIGIGQLKFGTLESECIAILGPFDRVIEDAENYDEHILEFQRWKIRLSFYKHEGNRLGYIRCANPALIYKEQSFIGWPIEKAKMELFGQLEGEWEVEQYSYFSTHMKESHWLVLHEEYGVVEEIEIGVPFLDDDNYKWPF